MAFTTIAIASGPGGSGKSTLATNLSCELAQRGNTVVLADFDIATSRLPYYLGNAEYLGLRRGKYSFEEYLASCTNPKWDVPLEEILSFATHVGKAREGELRIAMPSIHGAEEGSGADIADASYLCYLQHLQQLDDVRYLVLDIGAGRHSASVIAPAAAADVLITVINYTKPEPGKNGWLANINQALALVRDAELARKKKSLRDIAFGFSTAEQPNAGFIGVIASVLRISREDLLQRYDAEISTFPSLQEFYSSCRTWFLECSAGTCRQGAESFPNRDVELARSLLGTMRESVYKPLISAVLPVINKVENPFAKRHARELLKLLADEFAHYRPGQEQLSKDEFILAGILPVKMDTNIFYRSDLVAGSTSSSQPLVTQPELLYNGNALSSVKIPFAWCMKKRIESSNYVRNVGAIVDALESYARRRLRR